MRQQQHEEELSEMSIHEKQYPTEVSITTLFHSETQDINWFWEYSFD